MTTGTIIDVVMPQMGVSVSEGTISQWMKQEGDKVAKDETILEISTDKVDTEVPCPADGILKRIFAQEGDTLDVGEKLAEIETGDGGGSAEASAEPAAPAQSEPAPEPQAPAAPEPVAPVQETPQPAAPAPAQPAAQSQSNGSGDHKFVSPVVARIAAEHGVDPQAIPGTGNGGRVTKKDIMQFLESGGTTQAPAAPAPEPAAAQPAPAQTPPAAQPAAQAPAPAAPAKVQAPAGEGFTDGERVVPFSPMRKAIAKHMAASKATAAHVTSTMEVDMTGVVAMRNRMKAEAQQQWGVKLTFTHFVIRAIADAIANWPLINAEIRGETAVIKSHINLGIAVALDGGEGLIVPVVPHIEEKNLVGIARASNELIDKARTKQLMPDDVAGGTFTLTNPGIFGAIHGTPIISQPQVGIIDTEAIVKRPVVLTDADGNDSIAIRSMMNLCLSYDHRLIDGAYAVQFLAHVKKNLQEWTEQQFMG